MERSMGSIHFKRFFHGFTLIEVLVVLAILSILVAVAALSFIGHIQKTKEVVCNTNRLQVESSYENDLLISNVVHSDTLFEQHVQEFEMELCPDHGDFIYVDGKVQCSVHCGDNESDNEEVESVPFL